MTRGTSCRINCIWLFLLQFQLCLVLLCATNLDLEKFPTSKQDGVISIDILQMIIGDGQSGLGFNKMDQHMMLL
jgi:hypothetical protein